MPPAPASMSGQYGIGYARDVDSGVHDPAGRPDAKAGDDALTGLGALFRKQDAATQPATRTPPSGTARSAGAEPARGPAQATGVEPAGPLVSRPLVSPRLRADPRLRIWIIRTAVAAAVYLGFMIWHGWPIGATAAALYVVADVIYRSKTTSIVPAGVRVTSAQRLTGRRLKVLRAAGYLALNARAIPGTRHVVDHLVIGPAGVYSMDSQRLDKRLSLRMIDGMVYHGQRSMEKRIDHAKDEAKLAAQRIGGELGQTVRVRPVVVTYGPSSMWKIMQVKDVALFDGSRIGSYFRQQSKLTRGHHLDSDQIAMIFAAAERALPPLS